MFLASDSSQNIIRVLFVDFTKAFDVIDHNVLFNKFVTCGMPEHVVAWSMDFLCSRKQFVKIADSVSSVSHVTAGTPQGTVSGPTDFKLIIDDFHIHFNIISEHLDFDIVSLLGIFMFISAVCFSRFSFSIRP